MFFLLATQNKRFWFLKANVKFYFLESSSDVLYFKGFFNSFPACELVLFWIKSNSFNLFDFTKENFFEIPVRSFLEKTSIFLLLINIFLFRIEEKINIFFKQKISFVRYGTSFIIFSEHKLFCEIIFYKVNFWLKNESSFFSLRGNIFKIKNFVSFLGYKFRVLGSFCFFIPNSDFIKKRLKEIWFQNLNSSISFMICYFNFMIKNWINYFKGFLSYNILAKLDAFMWNRNLRYLKRKNPSKSYAWIYKKYYSIIKNSKQEKRFSYFFQGTNIFLLRFCDFKFLRYSFVKDILFENFFCLDFGLKKSFVIKKRKIKYKSLPSMEKFLVCPLCFKLLKDKLLNIV